MHLVKGGRTHTVHKLIGSALLATDIHWWRRLEGEVYAELAAQSAHVLSFRRPVQDHTSASLTSTGCTTSTMYIELLIGWQSVLQHELHIRNVEPASRYICCNLDDTEEEAEAEAEVR